MKRVDLSEVQELVRVLCFLKVFELAQYQYITYDASSRSNFSSLFKTMMLLTVGASRREMIELTKVAFIFRVLQMVQIYCTRGDVRWTMWSLAGPLFSTVDSIAPREMFLLEDVEQEQEEKSPVKSATQAIQVESTRTRARHSVDELPDIIEEEGEDNCDESVTLEETKSQTLEEKKKRVIFGGVDVHVFEMTMGDNPSVGSGPPIQLEWTPRQQFWNLPIDAVGGQFDNLKAPYPRHVRRFDAERRRLILRLQGCSNQQIGKAEKLVSQAQSRRYNTLITLDKQRRQECTEYVKELLFCGTKKQDNLFQLYLHDPFLSSPDALEGGNNLCRACARRCLKDTSRATFHMYRCNGRDCLERLEQGWDDKPSDSGSNWTLSFQSDVS